MTKHVHTEEHCASCRPKRVTADQLSVRLAARMELSAALAAAAETIRSRLHHGVTHVQTAIHVRHWCHFKNLGTVIGGV